MLRLTIAVTVIMSIWFVYAIVSPVTIAPDPVIIEIEEGWSDERIVKELKSSKLIRNAVFSRLYLLLINQSDHLKAGTYEFEGNVSALEVFSTLISGRGAFREKTITFIEGWSIEDMADYLERENIVPRASFLSAASRQYQFPAVSMLSSERTLEGYLFPDTYRVFHDTTAEDLVVKMLENFEIKVSEEMRGALTRQGRTLDEAIILASILEREVKTPQDKERAGGVLINRLEAGIPLQADSTVNYVTGKRVTRASSEDIKIDSPYNTYKYRGLPPGPISNPGLAAIKAAVYPEEHAFYYFLTTPSGEAVFSKTLDEHNRMKAKFYP